MSENDKNQITEPVMEKIGEDQLESAAGGGLIGTSHACYFEQQMPLETYTLNGSPWVKCKSRCFGVVSCRCYNTGRCNNRFHIAERHPHNPAAGIPSPFLEFNHMDSRKQIVGLAF